MSLVATTLLLVALSRLETLGIEAWLYDGNDYATALSFNPLCGNRVGDELSSTSESGAFANVDEEWISSTIAPEIVDLEYGDVVYPHECRPDRYYACSNGRLSERVCAEDHLFDVPSSECVHSRAANVVIDTCAPDEPSCLVGERSSRSPRYYPHNCDCRKYYECESGEPFKIARTCPDGQRFDKIVRRCVPTTLANCYSDNRPANRIYLPNDASSDDDDDDDDGRIDSSRAPSTMSNADTCHYDGQLLPHECRCWKYYLCKLSGRKALRECPRDERFNPIQSRCEVDARSSCHRDDVLVVNVTRSLRRAHLVHRDGSLGYVRTSDDNDGDFLQACLDGHPLIETTFRGERRNVDACDLARYAWRRECLNGSRFVLLEDSSVANYETIAATSSRVPIPINISNDCGDDRENVRITVLPYVDVPRLRIDKWNVGSIDRSDEDAQFVRACIVDTTDHAFLHATKIVKLARELLHCVIRMSFVNLLDRDTR